MRLPALLVWRICRLFSANFGHFSDIKRDQYRVHGVTAGRLVLSRLVLSPRLARTEPPDGDSLGNGSAASFSWNNNNFLLNGRPGLSAAI